MNVERLLYEAMKRRDLEEVEEVMVRTVLTGEMCSHAVTRLAVRLMDRLARDHPETWAWWNEGCDC